MEIGSDSSYGTWNHAESSAVVHYSLSVFHEIDFLVNEGYRRIPYGGIEHGGLLLGRVSGDEIRIEAFRQVEVEHASGPSFVLSEKDIAGVKEHIRNIVADPQLGKIQPVGLFISHSRRDFKIFESEWLLVESLFPQNGRLLVLVRPEKFKPTQFAFVLHGHATVEGFNLPPLRHARVKPKGVPDFEPAIETARENSKPPDLKVDGPEVHAPVDRTDVDTTDVVDLPQDKPAVSSPLATLASREATDLRVESQRPADAANAKKTALPVWAWLMAASATLIACSFLYFDWNFLQPPLELHANKTGGRVTVSWPRAETIRTNEAKLQIWSRSGFKTIPLPAVARETGRVVVDAPGESITVELIARHWLHDRTGMIRVIGQ